MHWESWTGAESKRGWYSCSDRWIVRNMRLTSWSIRQFRAQVPIIAVTVATCAGFAVALTPRWGLMGAGFAILTAMSVQVLGSLIVLFSAIRRSAARNETTDVDVQLAEREAVALFGNVGE
jgi:hypothetical protein